MEGSHASHGEAALPEETELAQELPETHQNRLSSIAALLKERFEAAGPPPESAPPLTLEQLVPAEDANQVTIERIPEVEPEEARKKLEAVYEAAEAEESPEEELPEEAQRERRVEIHKEKPPTDEQASLAATVKQVLASIREKTAAAHAAFGRLAPKAAPSIPLPAAFVTLPTMYKQAVILGFGMALFSLVSLALLA